MTKQQFIDYVAEFKKNPGEFTRDEIYEIGLKHKTLPQADKSWDWVKGIVGWQGSKESLRGFINHRGSEDNELVSEEPTKDRENAVDTYRQQIEDLYKEKTKIRDYKNAYHRSLRAEARSEELKELTLEVANKYKDLPQVTYKPSISGCDKKKEAIVLISDLHIGADCENYYNSYNTDIARERLNKLVSTTIDYCILNKVQTLHILNLGDLIHGIIHTDSRIQANLDAVEQTMIASELIAEAVNQLQQAAPEVTYRWVLDNHSRMMANKAENVEKEQLSRITTWFVKERLKNSKIKFMDDNIDMGVGRFKLKNGKTVMFAHGHEDSINQSWQNFVGLTREWVDYIILAHYHNPKEKSYNGSVVFVNGSIVGTEHYAFGRRLFSKASQKLLIFDNTDTYMDINIGLDQ